MAKVEHPVLLLVFDGWGHADSGPHNAISNADTPVWDRLWAERPHMLINCSGVDVGLPDEQMGNSEVGHMHIGAGRRIEQDYSRITDAIKSGDFHANEAFVSACQQAAANDHSVHVMGLLSPGGVHSHERHIIALLEIAEACGVGHTYVHAFLDGRDTPPQSAADSLAMTQRRCGELGNARIASISGRYSAMDRNKNWGRIQAAFELIVNGEAEFAAIDAVAALEQAYARNETDEFAKATVVLDQQGAKHRVHDGDVMLFANFRADRARQLTSALTATHFEHFGRSRVPRLSAFVTMADYGEQFDLPVAFAPLALRNTFGAVLAQHELRQFRIAETEKYAHVTFFFNGGEEQPFPGEERLLIPSPDVATYDLAPEMSAPEVTTGLIDTLGTRTYDAIICNYANADMVGHTGDYAATVACIEVLDQCLGRVIEAALENDVEIVITADHGNAEKMRACEAGGAAPHTAHTSNLVPFIYVGREARTVDAGSLRDIAPTLLNLMGLETPPDMSGKSLLKIFGTAQDAA